MSAATEIVELRDALTRRDELLRTVLYYADTPMTGLSLQSIAADIRRELTHPPSGSRSE